MNYSTLDAVENFKHEALRNLLAQCTAGQQELFGKVFPEGIEKLTDEKYRTAVKLCERTITLNTSPA